MLAGEFIRQIGSRPIPPVLLLLPGPAPFSKEPFEPMLAEMAVQKLVESYVDPSLRDFAFSSYHADEAPVRDIVLEAQTLPFLAERRVIVVRKAERYMAMSGERGSPLAPLLAYLESPSESTLLIFVSSEVDQRKKFFKTCREKGELVECPQLADKDMAAWVREEAKKRGKQIPPDAVEELMRRAGNRMGDVNNALQLVATYVGNEPNIRVQDVIAACADVAEESVFTLTDAIAESDTRKALQALHDLDDLGTSPEEIIGIINWLLENAYATSPQTGTTVKSQFIARKMAPVLERIGLEKLKSAFALCTETQFMIRNTGVDSMTALELLVIKLAFAPRRRPVKRA